MRGFYEIAHFVGPVVDDDPLHAIFRIRLRSEQLERCRPENATVIESKKARLEALRAKFGQNQDAKNILLLTRDTELTRYYVNCPTERDIALMTVRRELSA